jgi:hypothetical protein
MKLLGCCFVRPQRCLVHATGAQSTPVLDHLCLRRHVDHLTPLGQHPFIAGFTDFEYVD